MSSLDDQRGINDFKAPEVIPNSCKECKYFKKTGIIDIYKGHCTFYDKDRFSNWSCLSNEISQSDVLKASDEKQQAEQENVSPVLTKKRIDLIKIGATAGGISIMPLLLLFNINIYSLGSIGVILFTFVCAFVGAAFGAAIQYNTWSI